jgi:hypothetical protein
VAPVPQFVDESVTAPIGRYSKGQPDRPGLPAAFALFGVEHAEEDQMVGVFSLVVPTGVRFLDAAFGVGSLEDVFNSACTLDGFEDECPGEGWNIH